MKVFKARALAIVAILGYIPIVVFGMSSTNYQVNWDTFNYGGTDLSTSTNYQMRDSIGEEAGGLSSGNIYGLYGGYRVEDVTFATGTTPVVVPPGGSGGAMGGDDSAPMIFNVFISTSSTSATVTWDTNELANSDVRYGHTYAYASGTISGVDFVVHHRVLLTNLAPCQDYVARLQSADLIGNTSISFDHQFSTVCDDSPPVITNVSADILTDSTTFIRWNTDELADSRVEYGLVSTGDSSQGTSEFIDAHGIGLSDLIPGEVYVFRVISTDESGNTAISDEYYFTMPLDVRAPTNVLLRAIPADSSIQLLWSDPVDVDVDFVRIVRGYDDYPMTAFDGDLVYEGDERNVVDAGLINGRTYYYGAFTFDIHGNISSGSLASAVPFSSALPPGEDGEGDVSTTGTPVIVPGEDDVPVLPPSTITTEREPGLINVHFIGGKGFLPLISNADGVYGILANTGVSVYVEDVFEKDSVESVSFVFEDFRILLPKNKGTGFFEGTFSVSPGSYTAYVFVKNKDGSEFIKEVRIRAYERGRVVYRDNSDVLQPLAGVVVRLFVLEDGAWKEWSGFLYRQMNPQITSEDGMYGFEVPPGIYSAVVTKPGYESVRTNPVFIDSNVFQSRIEMRPIVPLVSLTAKAEYCSSPLLCFLQALAIALILLGLLNSTFGGVYIKPILLSALLFFIALRRRSKATVFGKVFHSLDMEPVAFATVTVFNNKGKKLFRSITGSMGCYAFDLPVGTYRIHVHCPHHVYPSMVTFQDPPTPLYFGDEIILKKGARIILDIPIDLHGVDRREARHVIALFCLLFSSLLAIIVPSGVTVSCVVFQLAIYAFFRRFFMRG